MDGILSIFLNADRWYLLSMYFMPLFSKSFPTLSQPVALYSISDSSVYQSRFLTKDAKPEALVIRSIRPNTQSDRSDLSKGWVLYFLARCPQHCPRTLSWIDEQNRSHHELPSEGLCAPCLLRTQTYPAARLFISLHLLVHFPRTNKQDPPTTEAAISVRKFTLTAVAAAASSVLNKIRSARATLLTLAS